MIRKNGPRLESPFFAALVSMTVCGLLCGCGKGGPETVRVRGKATLDGGPWPAEGSVFFVPIEASNGLPQRPAEGSFDANGEFSATSFEPDDGLLPGTYRIRIECWKTPPSDSGSRGVSYVSPAFEPPKLTVEPGSWGPVKVSFDVPGAK